jgi:hypothetical protein
MNAASRVHRALFTGVTGSPLEDSYLSLVLKLLEAIDTDGPEANVATNVVNQLGSYADANCTLAVEHIAGKLNTLADQIERA